MKTEAFQLNNYFSLHKKIAWIGENVPFPNITSVSYPFSKNDYFRSQSDYHGKFDLIVSHEHNLGAWKQWPLILDEMFALGASTFILSLRFTETHFLTQFGLKNFLFSRLEAKISVESEDRWDDQTYILTLKIEQKKRSHSKSWSFGVIYDGSKIENLHSLIESIRHQTVKQEYEIIVCGPDHPSLIAPDIRLININDRFPSKGWITEKKNLIVRSANFDNICVVHNRYYFDTNFLKGMDDFGYDYSLIVCEQKDVSGSRFPDWVTLGSLWNWTQAAVMEPMDYSPFAFINGGLIIAKKSILEAIPWNNLIFWNQGEDVELSRRFFSNGLVARFNKKSKAIVIESRAGYSQSFEKIPFAEDRYVLPLDVSLMSHEFVYYGRKYKIKKINLIDKIFNKAFVKIKSRAKRMRPLLLPIYKKLKPHLQKSPFLMKVVQKMRLSFGI